MHQFDLHRAVVESVDVADGFNLKPLLLELQAADRYHVLALSRHEAKLFEGNRNSLHEVSVSHFPSTIDDALGSELTEQHLTVASYGAGAARAGNGGTTPSVHAHGDKTDEVDNDRDRFFRSIDRSILEHHSRPSGLPLMLAALPEYQEPFHAISHNPFLMTIGLTRSPDSLKLDQMRSAAWQVMEPQLEERMAKQISDFKTAEAQSLGTSDLADLAEALVAGRVKRLLIEADRLIRGKLDPLTGVIEILPADQVDSVDLLDRMAAMALNLGGDVVIVPAEQMPATSGAAAFFRY